MARSTRRMLAWVLAIAMVITCGISGLVLPAVADEVVDTAKEYIPNGDFEGFGEATPVTAPWDDFAAATDYWQVAKGYGIEDSWGVKWIFTGTEVDEKVYMKLPENITLTEPGTYRFSFRARVVNTIGIKVGIDSISNATFINGTKAETAMKRALDHLGQWRSYHADFTVGEDDAVIDAEKGFYITVKTADSTVYIGDQLQFDCFSLKQITGEESSILDGDFDKSVDAAFEGNHNSSTNYSLLTKATNATIVPHPNGEEGNRVLKLVGGTQYMKNCYMTSNKTYLVTFDYSGGAFQFYNSSGNATNGYGTLSLFGSDEVLGGSSAAMLSIPATEPDEWKSVKMLCSTSTPNAATYSMGFIMGANPTYIDNFNIYSYDVDVETLSFDKTTLSMYPGRTIKLKAIAEPVGGNLNGMTWTSDNENVATVDGGTVTAIGAGTATITGTTSNGKSAQCVVTVKGEAALIQNGTFDVAEETPSWTIEGDAAVVEAEGRSGSKAGKLNAKGAALKQTVKGLTPNTIYQMSVYTLSAESEAEITLKNGDTVLGTATAKKGSAWAQTLVEFKTPATLAEEGVLTIQSTGDTAVLVDNVLLNKKASLVDFVVKDLYWESDQYQVKTGTELTFGVMIINQGEDSVPAGETITVQVRKNGEGIVTGSAVLEEELPTNDSVLILVPEKWKAEKGEWVISACANYDDLVLETLNDNNTYQKNLRVADEALTAPQVALDLGMTDLTFSDEFDGLGTIDRDATGADGFKWYVRRNWKASTITPDCYSIEDGILTLKSTQPGYHVTLSTQDYITGNGYTWNKGYLEMRFRIPNKDPGENNVDYDGSPAIWSFPDTKWREISGKNKQWVETDWLEYWGVTSDRPGGYSTTTLHDQSVNAPDNEDYHYSNKNAYWQGLGDEEWHTMGWLWVHNGIVGYLDGKEYFRFTYSEEELPGKPLDYHDSTDMDATGAFTLLNEQMNVLFISGSEKFPMEVDYVRIWQGGNADTLPEKPSAAVDVAAKMFWDYYGFDDYGDPINEVTYENYEVILSGAELYNQLSDERKLEINTLFTENGQPTYAALLAEAEAMAEKVAGGWTPDAEGEGDGEGDGDGEGENEQTPQPEKPAETGATTALPIVLIVVMVGCAVALFVLQRGKKTER